MFHQCNLRTILILPVLQSLLALIYLLKFDFGNKPIREGPARGPDISRTMQRTLRKSLAINDLERPDLDMALSVIPEALVLLRRGASSPTTNLVDNHTPSINSDVNYTTNFNLDEIYTRGSQRRVDLIARRVDSHTIEAIPPSLTDTDGRSSLLLDILLRKSVPVFDITEPGLDRLIRDHDVTKHFTPDKAHSQTPLKSTPSKQQISLPSLDAHGRPGPDASSPPPPPSLRPAPAGPASAPALESGPQQGAAALLAKRAGPSRWVVIVTVSRGYLDMAHQWLCSARLAGVGYYVFLAQDSESRSRLAAAGEPVVEAADLDPHGDLARLISVGPPGAAEGEEGGEYGSIGFQVMSPNDPRIVTRVM